MRLILLALTLTACQSAPAPQQGTTASTLGREPERLGYRVVATLPHATDAFTEGLFFDRGELFESTGLEGHSELRRVDLQTGRILQRTPIPDNRFGEGSIAWGDQIISLTYQDGIGYRWNRQTFQQLGTFRYQGEGWALTTNGTDIIMSDGTAQLRVLDPATLQERRRINVTMNGRPLDQINELEWVDGKILANVWQTNSIVRIDPASGQVDAVIDLPDLVRENHASPGADVLNGIAYDSANHRLYVTGKNWPHMYQIELTPAPAAH
jgi:glutaminyl-peptide cyclotransferase